MVPSPRRAEPGSNGFPVRSTSLAGIEHTRDVEAGACLTPGALAKSSHANCQLNQRKPFGIAEPCGDPERAFQAFVRNRKETSAHVCKEDRFSRERSRLLGCRA